MGPIGVVRVGVVARLVKQVEEGFRSVMEWMFLGSAAVTTAVVVLWLRYMVRTDTCDRQLAHL